MKHALALAILSLAPAFAQAPATILIPREKVSFTCTDTYFKSQRQNFLLLDENYPTCTLKMPLALRERWPGTRTYYVIPRAASACTARTAKAKANGNPSLPS